MPGEPPLVDGKVAIGVMVHAKNQSGSVEQRQNGQKWLEHLWGQEAGAAIELDANLYRSWSFERGVFKVETK